MRAQSKSIDTSKKPLFQIISDGSKPAHRPRNPVEQSSFPTIAWVALGAFITALASVPLLVIGNPSPLSPLPIYMLIVFFLAGPGAFLVLPACFAIEFLALHNRPNFLNIQAIFLAGAWMLTPLYFWAGWEYGLRWMGEFHTISVFVSHLAGLATLSGLAWLGYRKKSKSFNNILNILSFFFFTWGAFPVLGEMP